jgi:RecA/RadA recombinase
MVRMIVIEFVGLPASGKTTLASALKEHVAASGFALAVPSSSRSERLASKITALVTYRRAYIAAVKALAIDSRPLGQRWLALRWLLTTLAARNVAPTAGAVPVLIQAEGLAQRALLAFLDVQTGRVSPRLAEYLEHCPRPDVLVRVELEPTASVARQMARRADGQLARRGDRLRISESQLASMMASAEEVLDRAANEFGSADNVQVLEFDANDVDSATAGLCHQIDSILRSRTQPTGGME